MRTHAVWILRQREAVPMLNIWGERGALGNLRKPVLWLLALKDLLSRPAKVLNYGLKETTQNPANIIVPFVASSSGHDPNMSSLLSGGQLLPAKADFWAAKRETDPPREQSMACAAGRPVLHIQHAF